MKNNNIAFFLLGVFLVILTSATTVSVMTVKPATPKQVIVKYTSVGGFEDFCKPLIRQGYLITQLTQSSNGTCLIVMEKY